MLTERPDVLLHALAQLPDDVQMADPAPNGDARALRMLATAYGIESRLRTAPVSGRAVPPSPASRRAPPSMAELVRSLDDGEQPASVRRGDDGIFAGERIVIVTNLPTHYRVPLLNQLSIRLQNAGATLRVIFTGIWPTSRAFMAPEPIVFDHEFLRSVRLPVGATDAPLTLERQIRRATPTLVLVAGFSPAVAVRAALAARVSNAAYGVWSGAIQQAPADVSSLRRRQRRLLLRYADFAISYGHLSGEYLRELAPRLPLVYGRNTALIPALQTAATSSREVVEVLAVAQAIPRKALDVVVEACSRLRDAPCRLTVIGDGSELAALKARAGNASNVRFLGAVASDRTLRAYADADIFLFPTRSDVFGLVLVEAMGAGLATVVSSAAGAVADLALSGENCIVVDGHDPIDWAAAIRDLVEDPTRRGAIGHAARQTIARRWTLQHAVDAMTAGLRLGVLSRARRKPAR